MVNRLGLFLSTSSSSQKNPEFSGSPDSLEEPIERVPWEDSVPSCGSRLTRRTDMLDLTLALRFPTGGEPRYDRDMLGIPTY